MKKTHDNKGSDFSMGGTLPALRRLTIEDLGMLAAIEESGTLTGAAKNLHVTQSALSHRLLQLEGRLGHTLFERRSREMRPTAAGTHLTTAAKEVLVALAAAVRQVEDDTLDSSPEVIVATECYTCYSWLPRAFVHYRRLQPRARVSFVLEATRLPLQHLKDGRINFAIMSTPVNDSRFTSLPLFRDEIVAVVSKAHAWAKRSFVSPQDFETETVFSYSRTPGESLLLEQFLSSSGVRPAQHQEVRLTEAMLQMVSADLGVATMARWAVATEARRLGLRLVPLGKQGVFRQWSAVISALASSQDHLKQFAEVTAIEMSDKPAASGQRR